VKIDVNTKARLTFSMFLLSGMGKAKNVNVPIFEIPSLKSDAAAERFVSRAD